MKILCVGLNWRTPIAARERIAFDDDARKAALIHLREKFTDAEFAILSTCNRTELYTASAPGGAAATSEDLVRFLSDFRDVSLEEFHPHLYALRDRDAVTHLFEVASGLDSLALGEAQILGQVKDAYQSAVACGTAGSLFHAVFQRALRVAKRVQTETGLSKGRMSIASAAVDYIQGVFEVFHDKTMLVIGAGKMAELTVKNLVELEPARLLVTNRNSDRALVLAAKFGGEAWPFEDLRQALVNADIVVSSTAAPEPIVRLPEFEQIMRDRRQRLIAILDIALPRDFETNIGKLSNVLLWNIDDLERVRHETIRARRNELEAAHAMIQEEFRLFEGAVAEIRSGPIINRLDQEYQRIIDDELAWLLPQLNGLTDAHREKIQHFAHRIKNKLLHPPKTAIREDTRRGHHGILESVQRLFGLMKED